ncbi:restriction endonuclease [Halarcobacter sp.]|uniref:restriction endonuclease n=1 Tax=Halarcobacter sp. TaxID=2321133 RepID=UPI002AA76330|nr:restriction endonuclease [Halarcobacter sp.]
MNIANTSKPNLYQNGNLPLGELSSDSFEDFVYRSLVVLGEEKNFQMQSGRQPSRDEGFDCTAKKTTDNELVCIQCKRYNSTLYTGTVVEEIVKVALNGVLDNAIPKYHYIITSGNVGTQLRKELRQAGYTDLKAASKKLIDEKKLQLTLIEKAKSQNIDPYDAICSYLDSLNDLIVWSGVDFQNELVVIWSRLHDILENHFSLAVVFKEHPRPDFNLSDYLKKTQSKNQNLIPLQFQQAPLPNNLTVVGNRNSIEGQVWSTNDVISSLKEEKSILISSLGGSGKSSTLSIIENELINSLNDIQFLPIRINLRNYSRNTLKQKIDQELNINYGSWRSLPFKFIFLFDGLDEMLQHDTKAFIDEISTVIDGNSFILTTRSTGLNIETVLPSLDYSISIQPLSYRSAFQIAEKTFQGEELQKFYDEYRQRLSSIGFNFLSLPFFLSITIEFYKKNKNIPNKIEDILENWIQSKIKNDASKVRDTSNKVNQVPSKYIEQAFSLILYKSKIEKNLFSIPKDSFHEIIIESYDELSSSNSYIAKCLNLNEFVSMISHYEILLLEDDSYFSTPHPIISDYLVAKVFAKNWRSHLDTSLVNSFYDIWLYTSNFIDEEEREEFLAALLPFNLILAAKVSKKFGQELIEKVEKIILENEQSEKVLKRGEAIYALGILGTENCLERLRSTTNDIDAHHLGQKLRSLAVNGDKKTLHTILAKEERMAQAPVRVSGGTYEIWFKSPPSIITDIARSRLDKWINNKRIPLCFSLETIELFGDSYDIEILVLVIENTKIRKEFNQACMALYAINQDLLITKLNALIHDRHDNAHNAKKVLLFLGIKTDISEEFNFFIEQCNKSEAELIEIQHGLMELMEFIKKFELTSSQINILIKTYKSLKFPHDFYIYWFIWEIASESKTNFFLPVVDLTFSRNYSEEKNQAMFYLTSREKLNISDDLANKIDNYFSHVEEESYGIKLNYAKYYLKLDKNETAIQIVSETVEKLLINLSPETITHDQYSYSNYLTTRVFDFFNLDENITFDDSTALKLLLIDTKHTLESDEIKTKVLSKIDLSKIEDFANKIKDEEVKIYVSDYLLKNNFTVDPIGLIKQYLPFFISHHMFYPTIQIVCEQNWNDELSNIFLSSFLNYNWDQISAQMFEKYTDFYAQILTREQLIKFEQQRDKLINPLVGRIYKIWLEHNGLSESVSN